MTRTAWTLAALASAVLSITPIAGPGIAFAAPHHHHRPAGPPDKAKQQAIADFQAGTAAYQKGDYRTAAEDWDRAYQIMKDPSLLYNIGEAYEKAGDIVSADTYYQRYVDSRPTPQDAPQVRAHMADLAHKPATPPPVTPPPVTTAPLPVTPPSPMPPPASVPVVVEPPGKLAQNQELFAPEPASAPAQPAAASGGESSHGLEIAAWTGVAATVITAGVGGFFALEAQQSASDINRLQQSRTPTGAPYDFSGNLATQYNNDLSSGQNDANLGRYILIGAGVLAVGTAVLFIMSPSETDESPDAGPRVSVTPFAAPHAGGVAAEGSF